MSGAGENKEVEYNDDSFPASPVASLVSSRNKSPAESPVVFPLNSPSKPLKQPRHGTAFKFPKPKWLWKWAHRVIHFREQRKLDPNSTLGFGAVGRGVWAIS